jgi:hypothetical protein
MVISMPEKINFETVRRIALSLPDVEDGTTYGVGSLKIRGKLLTCPAIHKSAEPDTLAVRIPVEDRAELMEADPDTYYVTDHYVNYPVVLVRLSRIDPNALRDLLLMGWRFVNAKTPTRKRAIRKRKH